MGQRLRRTSITIVAAAIGNAVFDATGARIGQMPFTPEP
jgi:CO/xanthine dehydrogenase Mo-binding subunit